MNKIINGCIFPSWLRSDHLNLQIPSRPLGIHRRKILKILKKFHAYAEKEKIMYSLYSGSLVGYYWVKSFIPWDDDIDLIVSEKNFHKIKKNFFKKNIIEGWNFKESKLMGKEIFVGIYQSSEANLIKLLPLNMKQQIDPWARCGIDIMMCHKINKSFFVDSWPYEGIKQVNITKNLYRLINKNYQSDSIPTVQFANIEAKAIQFKYGSKYLEIAYGKNWCKKMHTSLK